MIISNGASQNANPLNLIAALIGNKDAGQKNANAFETMISKTLNDGQANGGSEDDLLVQLNKALQDLKGNITSTENASPNVVVGNGKGVKTSEKEVDFQKVIETFQKQFEGTNNQNQIPNLEKIISSLKNDGKTEKDQNAGSGNEKTDNSKNLQDVMTLLMTLFAQMKKENGYVPVEKNSSNQISKMSVDLSFDSNAKSSKTTDEIKDEKTIQSYMKLINELKEANKEIASESETQTKINVQSETNTKDEVKDAKADKTDTTPSTNQLMQELSATNTDTKTQDVQMQKVDINNFGDYLKKQIDLRANMKSATPDKIEVQINPEHLGKVEIKFEKVDGVMQVNIKVEDSHAKEQIDRIMSGVKEEFKDKGVQMQYQVEDQRTGNREEPKEKRKEEQAQSKKTTKGEIQDQEEFTNRLNEIMG